MRSKTPETPLRLFVRTVHYTLSAPDGSTRHSTEVVAKSRHGLRQSLKRLLVANPQMREVV